MIIDDYYGIFRGVDSGWTSAQNIPVKIDTLHMPSKHQQYIVDTLREAVRLQNFLLGMNFDDPVVETLPDRNDWNNWKFVGVVFNPSGDHRYFGTSTPIADFINDQWVGGHIVIYPKTFKWWYVRTGKIYLTVRKVLAHEFAHLTSIIHTSITPSMVNTLVVNTFLNALVYMVWDIALMTKYVQGYAKGEIPDEPIPVNCAAHFVKVQGYGEVLSVPLGEYQGELWCLVMQNTADNAWRPIYNLKFSKSYFSDPENYSFENVSTLNNDTLHMPNCFSPDGVQDRVLEKDSFGVWRLT